MTVYQTYICSKCGVQARNSYSEPIATRMLKHKLCFICDYWKDFTDKQSATNMTIIDGSVYTPGNRTSGNWRGMSGRRFDIEYIEPSIHAGKRITTFDLWHGGEIPKEYRGKFPDTAIFLHGAERCDLPYSEITTCWNPSSTKSEPYPLPKEYGIGT